MVRFPQLIGLAGGALFAACAAAQQIALTIDRIDGPSFTASRITGVLRSAKVTTLDLQIAGVTLGGNTWRNVRVACPDLRQEREQLVCTQARSRLPPKFRSASVTQR